jgi:hypothetical protein
MPGKRPVGRPQGQTFPFPVRAYENAEGVRLLTEMARRRGLAVAALLRQLVREEARRMKLLRQDWSAAAESAVGYYTNSPEVAEWQAADDGVMDYPTEEHAASPHGGCEEAARKAGVVGNEREAVAS